MVPAAPPSGFGYSETELAADRYRVRYRTPEVGVPADEKARTTALEQEKQRAYDLALWRAAQIALAKGYSQLSVLQEHRDAEVRVNRQNFPMAPGVYGPGGMLYPGWIYDPRVPYYGRPGIGPYWTYDDPFAYRTRVSASAEITASLEVSYAKSPSPGSLDAATTTRRLSAAYGSATY